MKTDKIPLNFSLALSRVLLILPLLVGCGTVPAGPVQPGQENPGEVETSTESSDLEAYLKVQSPIQQGSGEQIIVVFLLENHTQQGLYLLKWFTPLEGIGGDIFEVTRDGQLLPYMGPVASRSVPTPDSYIFLEPGKGVTAEVNIGDAYDFSQLGTYTIKFRSPRISHLARSEAEMATSLDELGPVNIPSNQVTLEVVTSSTSIGQPVRRTAEEAGEIISTISGIFFDEGVLTLVDEQEDQFALTSFETLEVTPFLIGLCT